MSCSIWSTGEGGVTDHFHSHYWKFACEIHLSLPVANFHHFKHLLLNKYLLYKGGLYSIGNSKAPWFHTWQYEFQLSIEVSYILTSFNIKSQTSWKKEENRALTVHARPILAGALRAANRPCVAGSQSGGALRAANRAVRCGQPIGRCVAGSQSGGALRAANRVVRCGQPIGRCVAGSQSAGALWAANRPVRCGQPITDRRSFVTKLRPCGHINHWGVVF